MSKRRAVLIGVSEYESDAAENLPIVRRDLETLHTVLEKSNFVVKSVGIGGASETGRSKILQTLRRECKDARGIETLILYFSGHGLHYRGKDYLVPSDAAFDDADVIADYLVSTDISDVVDQSGAKTVVFFVDACREGVKLGTKDTQLISWSQGERKRAAQRSYVMVFACGAGEVSQYVDGDAGFSLFSLALAQVLDPECSINTLKAVLDETQLRLDALASEYKKRPQKIRYAQESAVEDDIFARVICDGAEVTDRKDNQLDIWTAATLQSSLWRDDEGKGNLCKDNFKSRTAEIIAACWQQWQAASESFPQDTWRDAGLPIRVLQSLELLLFRSNPRIELSDAETALIITVPFVREAVLASGMTQAAQVDALSFNADPIDHGLRQSLDKNRQTLARFLRKAERLQEQGRSTDRDDVVTWMVYQCLFKELETWQPESDGGYIADGFIQALTKESECKTQLVSETLSKDRLLELAYCMYANFERIDRDDRPDALQIRDTVGSYREEQSVREKVVAYLLKLAALLAIDARILPDVLVDHIGLADPLTPEQIRQTIAKIRWMPSGHGRVLSVECNHPAIDLALQEHTEEAGFVLAHMRRQVEDNRAAMDALKGLPTHLLSEGIIAEKRNGEPVYQTPHVNFQLAHDEIRELLMGEQLYGDPMLAIRELYQNALDACRYRRARLQYLKQTGKYQGTDKTWEGRIIFRQMIDDHGRAYIECEDNGIGMAMQHLESCFARAGRRFAEMPEFIEEQAEWSKCDPLVQLYPSSQFGIGVLSYFMLADEIEIETCRLNRDGQPGERLQVRIPGTSGLFRVQQLGPGHESGSRIRLYLNRTRYKGKLISCIETLRKLLWVAEYRTEANHFGRQEVWEPGKLKHPEHRGESCLEIAGTDIWWVPEIYYYRKDGCILSDGLWTRELTPGFVVNLHDNFLPKLTVDRKEIIEYERSRITEELIQNAEPVLDWQGLDIELLWKLSKENPRLTEYIVEGLEKKQAILHLKAWGIDNLEVPVTKVGCFEPDYNIVRSRYGVSIPNLIDRYVPHWLLPLRLLVWQDLGLFNFFEPCLESIPPLLKPEYWPELQPGDGVILNERFPPEVYLTPCLDESVPPAHIIHAAVKLDEPLTATLKRFQKFIPLGLELPEVQIEALCQVNISDEDVIAVSSSIDEDLPHLTKRNEQWRSPWPVTEVSAGQIVITSVRLNESIADSIKRFQKFAPLGLKVTNSDRENLDEISVTPEDVIALSSGLTGEVARVKNMISPVDIASTAHRLNESVATTVKRFEKFIPIGLELPDLDYKALSQYKLEHDVVAQRIIERELWSSKNYVSVEDIVNIAGQLDEPISDTILRLQKFTPLGLKLMDIELAQAQSITVDREDMTIFSEHSSSYYNHWESSWVNNRVMAAHLVKAATSLNESIEDVLSRLHKFIPLGLKVPQFDSELLNELIGSKDDLVAMSKTLTREVASPHDILHGTVHPVRIILAALELKEPIPTTFARFQRFAPVLGLKLPEGDPSTWRFSIDGS